MQDRDDEERGRGRPTFLSIDLARKIAKLVRDGLAPTTAAASMGVVRRNFNNWMQHARADQQLEKESVYRELAEMIEVARAEYLTTLVEKLNLKMDGQWTGVKDIILALERIDPENYRKRETTEIIGTMNQRVVVEQLTTPEDENERLGRTLAIMDGLGKLPRPQLPAATDSIIEAEAHEVHTTQPESEADSLPEPDGA